MKTPETEGPLSCIDGIALSLEILNSLAANKIFVLNTYLYVFLHSTLTISTWRRWHDSVISVSAVRSTFVIVYTNLCHYIANIN